MEQAGITDLDDPDLNEKLISAMTEITVEGVTGTMTWDAEGEPSKSATAVVIKDGAYVQPILRSNSFSKFHPSFPAGREFAFRPAHQSK